jgi:hypothetical protein
MNNKKDELSDSDVVSYIWHSRVDDKLSWDFCSGFIEMNIDIKISADEVKTKFENYFINLVGIAPYTKCPICNKELLPRESTYGIFIGCSAYPECNFIATKAKPYKNKTK